MTNVELREVPKFKFCNKVCGCLAQKAVQDCMKGEDFIDINYFPVDLAVSNQVKSLLKWIADEFEGECTTITCSVHAT